jgi:hypothetical protein
MLSTVKERFIQVVALIPGLRSRKNTMGDASKFKATDHFAHRYAKKDVLRKALIDLKIKDEDIKIMVCSQFFYE